VKNAIGVEKSENCETGAMAESNSDEKIDANAVEFFRILFTFNNSFPLK
jgi:hypothetical protein